MLRGEKDGEIKREGKVPRSKELNLPPFFPPSFSPSSSVLIGYSRGKKLLRRLGDYSSSVRVCVCVHYVFGVKRSWCGCYEGVMKTDHLHMHNFTLMLHNQSEVDRANECKWVWMFRLESRSADVRNVLRRSRNGQIEPWEWGHGKNKTKRKKISFTSINQYLQDNFFLLHFPTYFHSFHSNALITNRNDGKYYSCMNHIIKNIIVPLAMRLSYKC